MAFDDTFISRYEDIPYSPVKDSESGVGYITGFREAFDDAPVNSYKYRIRFGDTFQSIATRAYNNAEYWYIIADMNKWIQYPMDIVNHVGSIILVPNKSFIQIGR